MQLAFADMIECRNIAAQIQGCMKFDGRFGLAEVGPRENRQTQVDGRGVEGIDGLVEFDAEVLVDI